MVTSDDMVAFTAGLLISEFELLGLALNCGPHRHRIGFIAAINSTQPSGGRKNTFTLKPKGKVLSKNTTCSYGRQK